jgi:hypothetical protein
LFARLARVEERIMNQADLRTLKTVIARSPILVRAPAPRLPAGMNGVDVAVLDWIVAHVRAAERSYRLM